MLVFVSSVVVMFRTSYKATPILKGQEVREYFEALNDAVEILAAYVIKTSQAGIFWWQIQVLMWDTSLSKLLLQTEWASYIEPCLVYKAIVDHLCSQGPFPSKISKKCDISCHMITLYYMMYLRFVAIRDRTS